MNTRSSNLPDLPEGIGINGDRLRIDFYYLGVRCREPLRELPKGVFTKSNIKYAERKRAAILHEIDQNVFNYSQHFPQSKQAARLAGSRNLARTVAEGITLWLGRQKVKAAPSTYKNYRSKAKHVEARWPKRRIADITKSEMELFQGDLLTKPIPPNAAPLSPKTVNDIFTVVRGVWGDAFADGIIQQNPLERIENIEHDFESGADPFTRAEIERIAKVKTLRQQELNMAMFNIWTGLSVSEVIALAWEDIDTERWVIKVNRARVNFEYKIPKTKSRAREIELLAPAIEWLKKQQAYTYMLPAIEIQVRQRDNVAFKTMEVRFVFLKTSNGTPHASDFTVRDRFWSEHLRRAKLRDRGVNQWRHTFASQMLSNYVDPEWIARQMGHTGTAMLRKHYAAWIPNDTPSRAAMISKMLGFEPVDDKSADAK